MTTGPNLDAAARFIRDARQSTLPPSVLDMARRCIVDWAASALAARSGDEAKSFDAYAAGWGSTGRAMSLFGTRMAAAPAALVNGAVSHLLDYDDLNLATAFHPSAPTLSSVFALAMDRRLTEAEVLQAFAVGYEVGTAFGGDGVGLALVDRGWHPTAILGHLSAAAACACLLDLDGVRIGHALGIAATQAGGLLAAGGTAAKPFHVGKAAMDGVMAAEAAAAGLDGPGALLDGGQGGLFDALIGRTPDIRALGQDWRILETSFKAYPCCQFAHAPLEACLQLAQDRPDRRRSVRVFANPVAQRVARHRRPQSATEARFSLAYAAALGLAGYRGAPEDFTPARLADPRVQHGLDLVELVDDTTIERWSSKVELLLADGEVRRAEVIDPLGSAGQPMGWTDLRRKFLTAASPLFGTRAEALLARLEAFGAGNAGDWFDTAFPSPD